MKHGLKALCVAVGLVLSGQVLADTTWTLNATETGVTSGGITETTTGWANTSTSNSPFTNPTTDQFALEAQTGRLSAYPGIGMNNLDACPGQTTCDVNEGISPEHAVDNNERYEMLLLSFTSKVKLTKITTSYGSPDSDMTVLAYTGPGTYTFGTNTTWSTLGSGWTVIGNYGTAALTTGGTTLALNTTSSSTQWLIGAYNPLAGGTTNGLTLGDDSIKFLSVDACVPGTPGCTTTTTQVPEPGSLALFGLAAIGMAALRRRQRA